MEKFTPFEKLTKKKQKELLAKKRGSWGGLSPVTRKSENPKAYDRKKSRRIGDDTDLRDFSFVFNVNPAKIW